MTLPLWLPEKSTIGTASLTEMFQQRQKKCSCIALQFCYPMKRPRTLISSPLDWQLTAAPVPAPLIPAIAERGGTQLKTPRPVLIVDTREQLPLDFGPYEGWFSGIKRKALKLGDYSIAGLENTCVVERKCLSDLVSSCSTNRSVFVKRLKRMAQLPHRLLVITSALSEVKSDYGHGGNPNRVTQSLIAILAGLQVPFICTETHQLGAEIVASYLYQIHLYHWLETNDHGRFLVDNDL